MDEPPENIKAKRFDRRVKRKIKPGRFEGKTVVKPALKTEC